MVRVELAAHTKVYPRIVFDLGHDLAVFHFWISQHKAQKKPHVISECCLEVLEHDCLHVEFELIQQPHQRWVNLIHSHAIALIEIEVIFNVPHNSLGQLLSPLVFSHLVKVSRHHSLSFHEFIMAQGKQVHHLIKIFPSLDLPEISATLAEKFLHIERDRKKA